MPNTSSGSFFGHYYIVMEAVEAAVLREHFRYTEASST